MEHYPANAEFDVESLFTDTAYNCLNCNKSLELHECYPVKTRVCADKHADFFCVKCFDKTSRILDTINLADQQDKEAKVKELPEKKPRARRAKKQNKTQKPSEKQAKKQNKTQKPSEKQAKKQNKTQKPSDRRFAQYDYVYAQFPGYGKKWYPAEIYRVCPGEKYHVYFLEDGSNLKNVSGHALREAGAQTWTQLKRCDFLNKPFEHNGEKWHALEVSKGRRVNKYGCCRVADNIQKVLVWLDVSEVQVLIRKEESSS